MDLETIILLAGMVLCGVLVGFPLGQVYQKSRTASEYLETNFNEPSVISACRSRTESKDILSAEVIE